MAVERDQVDRLYHLVKILQRLCMVVRRCGWHDARTLLTAVHSASSPTPTVMGSMQLSRYFVLAVGDFGRGTCYSIGRQ